MKVKAELFIVEDPLSSGVPPGDTGGLGDTGARVGALGDLLAFGDFVGVTGARVGALGDLLVAFGDLLAFGDLDALGALGDLVVVAFGDLVVVGDSVVAFGDLVVSAFGDLREVASACKMHIIAKRRVKQT